MEKWLEFPNVLIAAGIALLAGGLAITFLRARKGFLRLGLKEWAIAAKNVGGLIWVLSIMVMFLLSAPPVIGFYRAEALAYPDSGSVWFLHRFVPVMYMLSGPILAVWLLAKVFAWNPFKYTDREKELLSKEKAEMKARLRRLVGRKK